MLNAPPEKPPAAPPAIITGSMDKSYSALFENNTIVMSFAAWENAIARSEQRIAVFAVTLNTSAIAATLNGPPPMPRNDEIKPSTMPVKTAGIAPGTRWGITGFAFAIYTKTKTARHIIIAF